MCLVIFWLPERDKNNILCSCLCYVFVQREALTKIAQLINFVRFSHTRPWVNFCQIFKLGPTTFVLASSLLPLVLWWIKRTSSSPTLFLRFNIINYSHAFDWMIICKVLSCDLLIFSFGRSTIKEKARQDQKRRIEGKQANEGENWRKWNQLEVYHASSFLVNLYWNETRPEK